MGPIRGGVRMMFLRGKTIVTVFMALVLNGSVIFAQTSSPASFKPTALEPTYSEYYTIDEKNFDHQAHAPTQAEFSALPTELTASFLRAARVLIVNLLKWTLHNEQRPMPADAYIRKLHFGRWINDPTDDTCMNTRAKVLVRDSEDTVTFRNGKRCVVDMGKWQDPYSGLELHDSRAIQIDHMVPLKHAYMAGAWQWDYKTRCLYANYLGYRNHLVPATVHENTSKGDRAPEKYLPPNLAYRCQYVKDWLIIKLIWRLNMTPDEVQAIHSVVTNLNCKVSDFKVTEEDLSNQREYINANLDYCMLNKR